MPLSGRVGLGAQAGPGAARAGRAAWYYTAAGTGWAAGRGSYRLAFDRENFGVGDALGLVPAGGYGLRLAFRRGGLVDRTAAYAVVYDDVAHVYFGLARQGLVSRAGNRWLGWRGFELFYRGHNTPLRVGERFLSPVAREEGIRASRELMSNLLNRGATRQELADATAKYGDVLLRGPAFAPWAQGVRAGGMGIPFTKRLATTLGADFTGGPNPVVYAVLVRAGRFMRPEGYQQYSYDIEYIAFHAVNQLRILTTLNPRLLR